MNKYIDNKMKENIKIQKLTFKKVIFQIMLQNATKNSLFIYQSNKFLS